VTLSKRTRKQRMPVGRRRRTAGEGFAPREYRGVVARVSSNCNSIDEHWSLHPISSRPSGSATQRAEPEDQQLCTGSLFGPHQTSILNNQRGVQFDALTALVRASRPHSIWHFDNARSRVATHIRAEQTPGLMQSACHEALAPEAPGKARAAPLNRTSANLYTKQLPLVFLS
jgi:hypothetical protein